MPVDLEGLGKAISETIALKQIINKLTSNISDAEAAIGRNEKEIARLNSLIDQNIELEKKKTALKETLEKNQDELDTRLNKLKTAGVELEPLTNPNAAKGFMSL